MKTPSCKSHPPATPARSKSIGASQGMALIEALVASAVLGMGLVAATRLTLYAQHTANDTRQHTVAMALALDAIDCHQSGRGNCPMHTSATVQGTTYSLQCQIQPRPGLALEDLQVTVQWPTAGPSLGRTAGSMGMGSHRQAQERIGELVLHSSRDVVPAWLGVSLP